MGYWGTHPMEGDKPCEIRDEVRYWLIETLVTDIESEESAGKNENISDSLRNFVIERNFDVKKIDEDLFLEEYDFNRERDLWNTYKYDLINHFKDEETDDGESYFIIPFEFIEKDIHIKSEYIPYLIDNLLCDGGAINRGYEILKNYNIEDENSELTLEDLKNDHDTPLYQVLLVEKYATQLFDESNNELNDDFVAEHPEIRDVISKGLFQTIFENSKFGLVNVN